MTRACAGLRLAVIGTGALGSALLQRLAAAETRSVLLIDPDAVEPRNLPLSPYLKEALRAQPEPTVPVQKKAVLLAAHAWATHRLPWRALSCDVASVGWQRLRACDLLCCCTDSALSRAELAFIARTLGRPVLDGAVAGQGIAEGRVSYFSAEAGAGCYLCGLAERRRADVLGLAASAALGCRVTEEAAMTGTRDSLYLVADTMAAAVREIALHGSWRQESYAEKLHAGGVRRPENTVRLTRSATCPWHDAAAELYPLPWKTPVRESLNTHYPGREVLLDWPVCTVAMCSTCGRHCAPFQHVALVRSACRCLHCGGLLQPLATAGRIRAADRLAARSPQQLGQPIRHLYRLAASGY